VTALARLTRTEFRLFLREPAVVFFAVLFPCILVGILGSVPGFRTPNPDLGGMTVIDLYVTIAITMALALLGLQFTPATLANYRERGVLRRLSTTPVPPVMLLAAQLAMSLATAVVTATAVLGIGRLAFAVPLPRQLAGYLVAFVLAAAALFAIGLVVAALAPGGKAANGIGTVLFFPVMFFGGLWVPREVMSPVLRHIADLTPLGAGERALHDAATGSWPHLGQLAVLAGYVVVCGLAAARWFRWE
jgi:ABC-2 type transport system permease protein